MEHSQFSTDSFAPQDRFEVWRENISVIYEPELLSGESAADFHASVEAYRFGPATLARTTGSLQAFRRTEAMIAADSLDHYMVQVFLRGRCLIEAPNHQGCILPREVCVFDNSRTLNTVNEAFDLLAFVVPRSELLPYLERPDDLHYTRIPAASPLGAMFANHLVHLYEIAGTLSEDAASSLLAPTIEFLAAALNDGKDYGAPPSRLARSVLAGRVSHFVDANLNNPSLGPKMIMRRLGIPEPLLDETFGAIGGVEALIGARRMTVACELLRDRRRAYDFAEIAALAGFSTEWDFVQSYYTRFKRMPSAERERAFADTGLRSAGRADWAVWLSEA